MEKMQREKIEARLTAARQQQNRSPSNLIHVQSRVDEIDEHQEEEEEEESGWQMGEEERETTKRSIQRLGRENGHDAGNDMSDGGHEKRERVPAIEI